VGISQKLRLKVNTNPPRKGAEYQQTAVNPDSAKMLTKLVDNVIMILSNL
jgi:hypothetical protein